MPTLEKFFLEIWIMKIENLGTFGIWLLSSANLSFELTCLLFLSSYEVFRSSCRLSAKMPRKKQASIFSKVWQLPYVNLLKQAGKSAKFSQLHERVRVWWSSSYDFFSLHTHVCTCCCPIWIMSVRTMTRASFSTQTGVYKGENCNFSGDVKPALVC